MVDINERIQQYLEQNPDNLSKHTVSQAREANQKFGIGGWTWRRDLGLGFGIHILPNKPTPIGNHVNRRN